MLPKILHQFQTSSQILHNDKDQQEKYFLKVIQIRAQQLQNGQDGGQSAILKNP